MSLSIQQREHPGREARLFCYRCLKPKVACICAFIKTVGNQTGIIILQHPRERAHAIGTARIARLGLKKVLLRG